MTDITTPPTEVEIASLMTDEIMLPAGRDILRKLVFQRDELKKQLEEHANDLKFDPQLFNKLKADAERYRYMRIHAAFQDRNGPGLYWYLPRGDSGRGLPVGERLDKAIDSEIEVQLTKRVK